MSDSAVAERAADLPPGTPDPVVETGPGNLPLVAGRLLLAVLSGALLSGAFPSLGWWPLAPVAVAGLSLATRHARTRTAALLGFAFGLAFFLPHLKWSGIYVGSFPWTALSVLEALYLIPMAAFLPRAWRLTERLAARRPVAAVALHVLAVGGLWVAQEALRDRTPFGGFPWGRVAFSQSDSPYAGLAAIGGAPLVTWAVAASGALLAVAVVALVKREPQPQPQPRSGLRRRTAVAGPAALLAVGLGALGLAVPLPSSGQDGRWGSTARVAAVQGNVPQAGLEFNAQRRAVLDNHARATLALAEQVRQGKAVQPDLVLWPENASDIDPLRNADAAEVIDEAVAEIGAPTLVGAVLDDGGDTLKNAGIVWSPVVRAAGVKGAVQAPGPDAMYLKQHPVPFGEYIPYRSFFRHFSDKVDLVSKDFEAGHKPGVLSVGPATIGDVICFEVAYDDIVRATIRRGADLLVVQTNNATFGYTDESVQQLAMSRLRAIETGRSVVHVSTVGVSAIILPNGKVAARSGHFTQDVLQAEVPLRHTQTVATRVGAYPEAGLVLLGLLALLARGSVPAAGSPGRKLPGRRLLGRRLLGRRQNVQGGA